jgi:hypothetical protein
MWKDQLTWIDEWAIGVFFGKSYFERERVQEPFREGAKKNEIKDRLDSAGPWIGP